MDWLTLPPPLLGIGPGGLAWWQWIGVAVVVTIAWFLGRLLGWATRRLLGRIAHRTRNTWDDALIARLGQPASAAWMLLIITIGIPLLELRAGALAVGNGIVRAGFMAVFFWVLVRLVDIGQTVLAAAPFAQQRPSARALLAVGSRLVKAVLLAIAVVALFAAFGFPVASLLAGLGIGGLALALAAQKTVENLFGTFSIGVDQPLREGDFVKVDGAMGTVEAIGLRSTRIRTLDRTVVTVPNGRLADMTVETFAPRDRIRLVCELGLVYSTRAAQLRQVLAGVEGVLRQQPKLWLDSVVVRFKELGREALAIEVMVWFETRDMAEFQAIRQDVLIGFMEVVERAGTAFAFPTRTIHLASEPPDRPPAEPDRIVSAARAGTAPPVDS